MIEWVSQALRWLHLLSGACALGWFWWLIQSDLVPSNPRFVRRSFTFLLLVFILTGLTLLARQAAIASGSSGVEEAVRFSISTQFGQVWLARLVVALVLLGLFFAVGQRGNMAWFFALTMLQFSIAFVGHGAASDAPTLSIIGQGIHVTAASLWLGGLTCLGVFVCRPGNERGNTGLAMRKFSELALVCVILIAMTGIVIATLQIRSWPALFGTIYGERLLIKLLIFAGVLAIAGHLRWRVLGSVESRLTESIPRSKVALALGIEIFLGLSVLWIAASLAVTPPAQHEQIIWPFNFRVAEQVTWLNPDVRAKFWLGASIFCGTLAGIVWMRGHLAKNWRVAILSLIPLGFGFYVAISPLTVPAFPDSYRRSAVPFHALSITGGKDLYAQHCVSCHGIDATGDGPRAVGFVKPPADLTAPHLGDHTPGDLYWWLSHGIKDTAMPAFPSLTEEERWDLVNFLHVLASGYEARVLRARIIPERPWLGAPDFNFVGADGSSGSLRDFRDNAVVLLVLCTDRCADRLRQLDQMASTVGKFNLTVLAVPMKNSAVTASGQNIIVVTDGNREIVASYMLFRRTIENPRAGEQGVLPTHMEFLIDRFGYVRARWLPEDSSQGWDDLNDLSVQIESLSHEPRIKPPPDEHLH